MEFEAIPAEFFDSFHEAFNGDTMMTFSVCHKCGGACEQSKIATLLPGEKEYLAARQGLEPDEFARRYLDVLEMEDGTRLDVLTLEGCLFLSPDTHACACRGCKPILCEIYPVVFEVEGDEVRFFVDDWCPMMQLDEARAYFEKVAIPLLAGFPMPVGWCRLVESYDPLYFDYSAIERLRASLGGSKVFPMARLLECQQDGPGLEPDREAVFEGDA